MQKPCQTGQRLAECPRRFYLPPGACRVLVGLVLHDSNELARLKTSAPFCGVATCPLGAILACGLAIIVIVSEIEVAVHTNSDECAVGLKGDAVLTYEVILIGNIPATTRALEVLNFADCTELAEEEGTSDGLFHILAFLRLNFSYTIGKSRAKLFFEELVAIKDFEVTSDELHNTGKEFFKVGLRSIEEADFTSVQSSIGCQRQVVVGDADVVDVGEIDSVALADDEFHIVHILGLHYLILQTPCHYPAKEKNKKG